MNEDEADDLFASIKLAVDKIVATPEKTDRAVMAAAFYRTFWQFLQSRRERRPTMRSALNQRAGPRHDDVLRNYADVPSADSRNGGKILSCILLAERRSKEKRTVPVRTARC